MDEKRLAEIQARCEAATPGPWVANRCLRAREVALIRDEHDALIIDTMLAPCGGRLRSKIEDDATFIACARQDIPDLLARVAELEEAMRGLLVVKDIGDDQAIYCPWCKAHARSFKTPRIRHKTNCPRQKAAKLVQPEAALCVGS